MITGQAEPSAGPSDFEGGVRFFRLYTTVNVSRKYCPGTRLAQDEDLIGSFTQTVAPCVHQFDAGPQNLGPGINLDDRSENCLHQIERMPRTDGDWHQTMSC